MSDTNGRKNNAPRKLKSGMAVVVWIKPEYPLFWSERQAGLQSGKWFKGTVDFINSGFIYLTVLGQTLSNISPGLITIRSTAWTDNIPPSTIQKMTRAKAVTQAKRLAKVPESN